MLRYALLLLAAIPFHHAVGQGLDPKQLARWTEFYQREAGEYEVFLQDRLGDPLQFVTTPVFRWAAPTTQNEFNGVIFVWTRQGRPEALGSIWSVASKRKRGQRNIAHTFHSMSQQPLLANRKGQALWHPEQPGLKLKPIPGAPAPAETSTQRRLQIRALSREFSAVQILRTKVEPLEMLPRPLYEYDSGDVSGALFTFLRDWDPEVMLLIESRQTEAGPRWHFEGLRFCMLSARIDHRGQEVWSYQRGGPMIDPNHYYFSLHGASLVEDIDDVGDIDDIGESTGDRP